jgi:uncharacterized repeat protein (TIGR03803 family)
MRNAEELWRTPRKGLLKVSAVLSLMMIVSANLAQAQTLTTLHSFTGGADGAQPYSTLAQDKQGNLYGTANSGGIQSTYCQVIVNGTGCGTLFKLTPSEGTWSFNVLYGFQGYPEDGSNPDAESLLIDDLGNIYGTTAFGGDVLNCDNFGCGTVFTLTPDGIETVLYNFHFAGADAFWPFSGVVLGKNGNLYGTTFHGGPYQSGTVYEVTPSGTETVFYNFTGKTDGGDPFDALVLDDNGNLYGTTQYGGAHTNCAGGCGTVFKLAPDGTETVLYSFAGGSDGSPWGGLVRDNEGNLYGTTWVGGSGCGGAGCGTVFELNPTGTKTVLHSFNGSDGASPRSELILDGNGNLYGTTYGGGAYSAGAVFELTPTTGGQWTETLLHSFSGNQSDGSYPGGGLLLGDNGKLYGTTQTGGAYGLGTVFEITLVPRVTTTTSVNSNLNPSTYGQSVTFTATVTSDSNTPTGIVQILYGSSEVGYGTLAGGNVSIPVSSLPAGTDSITASYLGGSGFAPSKSSPLIQTVSQATTTALLVSSLNPAGTNQAVTFTATVASQYGGAATGTVTFMAGAQSLGSATVSGNVAALTTSFAIAGTYSITARYSGDSNNTGSTSAALSEQIITSTTTTLASSLNPSVVGQAVTFTASVTSSGGTPPSGETIAFYNGSTVLGTAPLSGGAAALTTSTLPPGIFTITAKYPGDSKFAASTSPGLRQVVNSTTKSATSTTLASSLNPSIYGQKIIFTAAVTGSGPLAPTGTVVFTWAGYTVGSATLNSSGIATLTKSNLNADLYPLTAVYKGDTNNLGSTSAVLNQTVLQTTSAATISSSLNPSAQGQAVTFTAKVTSPTVTPTGPVTFKAGTTVLGTVQLSGGKASYTTTALTAGSTVIKVTYNGDSDIKGCAAVVTQVVQP